MVDKILSEIDIFAPSVNFTFKEKHRHGTVLGGCCTLSSVLFIGLYILSLGRNTHYEVTSDERSLRVPIQNSPTNNSMTFPAITITFDLSKYSRHNKDPFAYIEKYYTVVFNTSYAGTLPLLGIDCEKVKKYYANGESESFYSNETLTQAGLKMQVH